jgi:hypothetical protein
MVQLPGGARFVSAFWNVTSFVVRFVEWKAIPLTTSFLAAVVVVMKNLICSACVLGAILQKAVITVKTAK